MMLCKLLRFLELDAVALPGAKREKWILDSADDCCGQ
jgi:hypothetical protein